MSDASEFAEFADGLRRRREQVQRAAPAVLRSLGPRGGAVEAPIAETSRLLETAIVGLSAAEAALRAQNEELCSARYALEEREARFRRLFELAPVAYVVTTRHGQILEVNGAACALLRCPPNALAGKPLAGFVDPSDREAFRAAVARACASGGVEEWPSRLTARDVGPVECRLHVRALPGSDGEALAWCIAEDVRASLGEF